MNNWKTDIPFGERRVLAWVEYPLENYQTMGPIRFSPPRCEIVKFVDGEYCLDGRGCPIEGKVVAWMELPAYE